MKDNYFLVVGNKKYCAAFKVYPSGFPVTSLTHAVDESKDSITLCGLSIVSDKCQWYYDEWSNGIECKKCNRIVES